MTIEMRTIEECMLWLERFACLALSKHWFIKWHCSAVLRVRQVRFFGTYNFCWIEAHRNLAPLDEDFEGRSSKSKVATFLAGAPAT